MAIIYPDLEDALAAVYCHKGSALPSDVIAALCDKYLDKSGAMLGRVRARAEALKAARNCAIVGRYQNCTVALAFLDLMTAEEAEREVTKLRKGFPSHSYQVVVFPAG